MPAVCFMVPITVMPPSTVYKRMCKMTRSIMLMVSYPTELVSSPLP